jgi:hypothetical protein
LLIIRTEQMRRLRHVPANAFEAQLVRHFFRFYPDECGRAGEPQVRKMVQLAIRRAAVHGYFARREVALYANLMVILGCSFDLDPQIPWAAEQLNDLAIEDSFPRIRRVFASTLAYLEACFGAENGQMLRTLVRIRDFDLAFVPQSRGLQFHDDLCEILRKFCPPKYEHQGEAANRALVRAGIKVAESYGITGNTGRAVCVTLMFMLGSGFDEDPMYPWAARVLRDAGVRDEKARVAQLYARAADYVDDVLAEQKAA